MLLRPQYLTQIQQLAHTGVIIVLVGMRRIGKSTILKQYIDHVGLDSCLYIPKESLQFDHIQNYKQLYDYVHANLGSKTTILIDEVQLITGWQKTINSLLAEYGSEKTIIITGSNSDLLSSEISTLLRGRTFDIRVHPFSFDEYCRYLSLENNSSSMQQYLTQGGMPSLYVLDSTQQQERVQGLINTVFLKDIVARYEIRDVELLRSIFMYLVNTVGDQSNMTNIKNYLINTGYHINLNTLTNYVGYIVNSLMVGDVSLYNIQGKKILERLKKYYTADHALRSYLFSGFDVGFGKLCENYIYISLLRAGYHVSVGRIGSQEIDFIAERHGHKIYVQACYLLSDQSVVDREFGSLTSVRDSRPKYVVSMDPLHVGTIQGAKHIQVWNWELELQGLK